jgi:hypothetical protein
MYEFQVLFKLKSGKDYIFDDAFEYDGIKLKTENGKICGELVVVVDRPDFNLAREEAIRKIETLTLLLTPIFEDGFAVEDVKVTLPPRIIDKGREKVIEIYEHIEIRAVASLNIYVKYTKEKLAEAILELKQLEGKLQGSKQGEALLRAIKWWRKGFFEEDKVDKFLDCYIAFEMLASILGYTKCKESEEKCKAECAWAKRFAEDYSITFRVGETSLTEIRNNIMHAPGPEKDEAEKLAAQHADRLGMELLNTIKKIISAI